MTVALGTSNSKFSAAVNSEKDISVSGTVKGGTPYLTAVGSFDVDLAVEVRMHTCFISMRSPVLVHTALCRIVAGHFLYKNIRVPGQIKLEQQQ